MNGTVEQGKMLAKLLKIIGAIFFCGGWFLTTQVNMPDPFIRIVDAETDKLLGYAFMAVGITDFILAVTILNPKKTK